MLPIQYMYLKKILKKNNQVLNTRILICIKKPAKLQLLGD